MKSQTYLSHSNNTSWKHIRTDTLYFDWQRQFSYPFWVTSFSKSLSVKRNLWKITDKTTVGWKIKCQEHAEFYLKNQYGEVEAKFSATILQGHVKFLLKSTAYSHISEHTMQFVCKLITTGLLEKSNEVISKWYLT